MKYKDEPDKEITYEYDYKYIIVDKEVGLQVAKKYKIQYQVAGYGAKIFECEMYCLGTAPKDYTFPITRYGKAFAYLSTNSYPHIETEEDRTEFLKELCDYCDGGSYRKRRPIIHTPLSELQMEKKSLEYQLSQVEQTIQREKHRLNKKAYDVAYKSIDNRKATEFRMDLLDLFQKYGYKYTLYAINNEIYVWDNTIDIAIYKYVETTEQKGIINVKRNVDLDVASIMYRKESHIE